MWGRVSGAREWIAAMGPEAELVVSDSDVCSLQGQVQERKAKPRLGDDLQGKQGRKHAEWIPKRRRVKGGKEHWSDCTSSSAARAFFFLFCRDRRGTFVVVLSRRKPCSKPPSPLGATCLRLPSARGCRQSGNFGAGCANTANVQVAEVGLSLSHTHFEHSP